MISTNLFEITFQIVNFLILLWLLNKLLFKSLVSYLDKRQDIIKSDLELAKSNKLESEKIIEKQNESLQQALLEAKSIREKAEDSSKKEREKFKSSTTSSNSLDSCRDFFAIFKCFIVFSKQEDCL